MLSGRVVADHRHRIPDTLAEQYGHRQGTRTERRAMETAIRDTQPVQAGCFRQGLSLSAPSISWSSHYHDLHGSLSIISMCGASEVGPDGASKRIPHALFGYIRQLGRLTVRSGSHDRGIRPECNRNRQVSAVCLTRDSRAKVVPAKRRLRPSTCRCCPRRLVQHTVVDRAGRASLEAFTTVLRRPVDAV